MANDPNQSNKGAPNTIDTSGFSDIENIGRKSGRHTAEDIAQRVRLSNARRNINVFEEAISSGIAYGSGREAVERGLSQERKSVNSLEPRIELRAEAQRQRFTSYTQSRIESAFSSSSVNGQSSEFAASGTGQRMALGQLNTPYEELAGRRSAIMGQINNLGQRAMGVSGDLYNDRGQQDPGKLAELQQIYQQKQRLINRVGTIDAAQRQQRRMGMDPESRADDLFSVGQKANSVLYRAQVGQELQSGSMSGMGVDQLKQRELQLSQQLNEELTKLKDTAGKSAEEIKKMQEAATLTAEEFKKTQEAISQGGAGGGINRGGIANGLNLAGSIFGAGGNAVQQIAVNQRLGQVQNVSGFAGIENDKYRTYKSAAGGSVADQLALSQFGAAEGFGRELKVGSYAAQSAYTAGGVAQIAAGATRLSSLANPLSDILNTSQAAGTAIQGIGDITQGAATTAITGADMARGVSAGQAQIAGVNAQMEARRQISAISSEQLQGFRDFSVGMGSAAMGMGSSGAGFVDRMINKGNLARMTNSRISPEQMAQMAQVGVSQIGSTFNENQIFGARGLERSGLGTMGENMQRMAQLASAGSNNPQAGLGSVLEAAFSKSLDGSKVLNMMVENTASMVQSSAGRAMGIDTTGAAAAILAGGIDTNNPNKEFALQRAATAAQRMREIGTDSGMNFAAMSATSRISKMTGLGGTEAIIAQGLDDSTLRSLKGMNPNDISSKLLDRGINVQPGQEKETVDQLIKARLITNLQGGGAGIASGVNASKLADQITSGKRLTDFTRQEQAIIGQAGTLAGFSGGAEFLRSATAINNPEPNSMAKGRAITAMQGEGGSDQQKTLDDMRTQGFKQLSQAAEEATANFKSAGEALKALGILAKSVEDIGDKGGEGKFKTAAADAAGSFGKSTITFKESVSDFQKAVNMMMERSGVSGTNDTSGMLRDLEDKMRKR